MTLLLGNYCIFLHGYEYEEAQFTVLAPSCVTVFLVATGIGGLYVIVIILITFLITCVLFDVFPTVHHSIGYFLEPTLMHTSI